MHDEIKRQLNNERVVKITYVLHGQFAADYLMSHFVGLANLILIPVNGDMSNPRENGHSISSGLPVPSPSPQEKKLR